MNLNEAYRAAAEEISYCSGWRDEWAAAIAKHVDPVVEELREAAKALLSNFDDDTWLNDYPGVQRLRAALQQPSEE